MAPTNPRPPKVDADPPAPWLAWVRALERVLGLICGAVVAALVGVWHLLYEWDGAGLRMGLVVWLVPPFITHLLRRARGPHRA